MTNRVKGKVVISNQTSDKPHLGKKPLKGGGSDRQKFEPSLKKGINGFVRG